MVNLAAMLMKTQAFPGLPSLNQPGGSGAGAEPQGKDAFSSLFDNAVRDSFAAKAAAPAGKSAENATEGEIADAKADTPEDEIPGELAVLASYTIQNSQQAEPDPEPAPEQVVSILEGNMDIEASAPEAGTEELPAQALPVGTAPLTEDAGEELTARMPQAPGQTQQTAETQKQQEPTDMEAPAAEEGPCPLENTNDSSKAGSSFESNEDAAKEEPKTDDSRAFELQQKVDISPERLSSAEKLNAAAESRPAVATAETLFDTMVQKIEMANTEQSTFMEIRLKPEFLGKVSIQLALGDAGLEIKIKAEDAGVKGLLAGQINQLKDSLLDKGVRVTEVEVAQTNISDHAYDQTGSQGKNQAYEANEVSRGRNNIDAAYGPSAPEEAEAAAAGVLDVGLSSVEYRA